VRSEGGRKEGEGRGRREERAEKGGEGGTQPILLGRRREEEGRRAHLGKIKRGSNQGDQPIRLHEHAIREDLGPEKKTEPALSNLQEGGSREGRRRQQGEGGRRKEGGHTLGKSRGVAIRESNQYGSTNTRSARLSARK
jgi:hypothetical protein